MRACVQQPVQKRSAYRMRRYDAGCVEEVRCEAGYPGVLVITGADKVCLAVQRVQEQRHVQAGNAVRLKRVYEGEVARWCVGHGDGGMAELVTGIVEMEPKHKFVGGGVENNLWAFHHEGALRTSHLDVALIQCKALERPRSCIHTSRRTAQI